MSRKWLDSDCTLTYNYATGITVRGVRCAAYATGFGSATGSTRSSAHKIVCQTGIFYRVFDSVTREAVDTPPAPLWWPPTDVTIQYPRSYHLLGIHFGHECTPGDI